MTDYRHPLEFGLFPTPQADRAEHLLEITELAEVLGLDLVSVQDHPYQAKFLDTWTLLSVLGARTSTIKLAPNVASLPLRPPVVLAKSTATLDVLTGGRVELGLGAGAFWDAIEAAGGARRTPGQAVDALVEAISLIRAFWAGGTLRFDGQHYRAHGLHAGPTPAHDIPIWLGAYKPRMITITGRLADGWVPSMGYADPPALPDLNARLDEAAVAAGRGPEQIRRVYNIFGQFGTGAGFLQGTPANWADQLATLTLEQGMSTYILGTDDTEMLRRFAAEVVPAVRERIEDGRAHPPLTPAAPAVATAPPAPDRIVLHATEDDGTRLRPMPWDETDRPTAGESPDTSYTAMQLAAPKHLIDVHDSLRAELNQVRDIIDQVRSGQLPVGSARSAINTMTIRQNNWTLGAYCESYCRIVTGHHGLEDRAIFPHLRRSEPALGAVLDRLHDEHEVIAGVLDELDRALVGLVGAGDAAEQGRLALDELQQRVDTLTDTLLSHLAYEERELIGPLARHGFYLA